MTRSDLIHDQVNFSLFDDEEVEEEKNTQRKRDFCLLEEYLEERGRSNRWISRRITRAIFIFYEERMEI